MSKVIRYIEAGLLGLFIGVFLTLVTCMNGDAINEIELQDESINPYETVKYSIPANSKYTCKVFGGASETFFSRDSVSILFKASGEYHVVLAYNSRKGRNISYGKVIVQGSSKPDDPSVTTALKDKVHNAVLSVIPEEYRGICKSLATNYRAVASKQYASEDELLAALASGNRDIINFDGSDMRKESVFTDFFRKGGTLDLILLEAYPKGIQNWGPVLLEIADGLE